MKLCVMPSFENAVSRISAVKSPFMRLAAIMPSRPIPFGSCNGSPPDMCVARLRRLTVSKLLPRRDGRSQLAASHSDSLPLACAQEASTVVNVLLTQPISNSVSSVTGLFVTLDIKPYV